MAKNIKAIQSRIKSINSTKQITHAMKLVASSKLRKAREQAEARRPYFETMIQSIKELASEQSGSVKNAYLKKRDGNRNLYIIVSADKGLAGGYNSNVFRLAVDHIEGKENAELIIVGTKGVEHFKSRDYKILKTYTNISEKPTYGDARAIVENLLTRYNEEQVDNVYIVYTKFVSTLVQRADLIQLLPLSDQILQEEIEEGMEDIPLIRQYEPGIESLLNYLVPKYIMSTVYGALIESSASEQSARRMAMETATDNANEMIDSLTLQFNRARQEQITGEITEIVAGANASK